MPSGEAPEAHRSSGTTDVGHDITTTGLVFRVIWTLQVHHDFFPTIPVAGDDRNLRGFPREFAKTQTSEAFATRLFYVILHFRPPTHPFQSIGISQGHDELQRSQCGLAKSTIASMTYGSSHDFAALSAPTEGR